MYADTETILKPVDEPVNNGVTRKNYEQKLKFINNMFCIASATQLLALFLDMKEMLQ